LGALPVAFRSHFQAIFDHAICAHFLWQDYGPFLGSTCGHQITSDLEHGSSPFPLESNINETAKYMNRLSIVSLVNGTFFEIFAIRQLQISKVNYYTVVRTSFQVNSLLLIACIFLKLHVLINTHEHRLIEDGTYFDISTFVVSMFKLLMGRTPLFARFVYISA
jgi:hypothetical protein